MLDVMPLKVLSRVINRINKTDLKRTRLKAGRPNGGYFCKPQQWWPEPVLAPSGMKRTGRNLERLGGCIKVHTCACVFKCIERGPVEWSPNYWQCSSMTKRTGGWKGKWRGMFIFYSTYFCISEYCTIRIMCIT